VVSERGFCPNRIRAKATAVADAGLWGWAEGRCRGPVGAGVSEPNVLGWAAGGGESPVGERCVGRRAWYPSTAGHGKSRGKLGGPPSKASYPWRPIAHSTVRERWKAPRKGDAKSLKPRAPEQSEPDIVG
jgi:hypothetical protein